MSRAHFSQFFNFADLVGHGWRIHLHVNTLCFIGERKGGVFGKHKAFGCYLQSCKAPLPWFTPVQQASQTATGIVFDVVQRPLSQRDAKPRESRSKSPGMGLYTVRFVAQN